MNSPRTRICFNTDLQKHEASAVASFLQLRIAVPPPGRDADSSARQSPDSGSWLAARPFHSADDQSAFGPRAALADMDPDKSRHELCPAPGAAPFRETNQW